MPLFHRALIVVLRAVLNRRRFALFIVALVLADLAAVGMSRSIVADVATPARLSLPPGVPAPSLSHHFESGWDTSSATLTLIFLSSEPASDLDVFASGSLPRADGGASWPASQIRAQLQPVPTALGPSSRSATRSAAAQASAQTGTDIPLQLSVTVDPTNVAPGTYQGLLVVRAKSGETLTFPIALSIRGGHWLIFVIVVAVATGLGTLAKWLSETGAALRTSSNRYDRLFVQLDPIKAHLPPSTMAQLQLVAVAIGQFDDTTAQTLLTALEQAMPQITTFGQDLTEIDQELKTQADLITGKAVPRGSDAIAAEARELASLLDTDWPLPPQAISTAADDLKYFRALTQVMRRYIQTPTPPDEAVIARYANSDFPGGYDAASQPPPGPALVAAGARGGFANLIAGITATPLYSRIRKFVGQGSGQRPQQRTSWWSLLTWKLIKNGGWIVALLVVLASTLIGLQVLYVSNPAFGASLTDWLIAIGWGFGVGVTGVTLTQVGTNLYGRGPTIA